MQTALRNRFNDYSDIFLHVAAVVTIIYLFMAKYLANMLKVNELWRSADWYAFLSNPPSAVAKAGLLNPADMTGYLKTLSISLGHQLLTICNKIWGFDGGLKYLFIFILSLVIISTYLVSLHISRSKIKAFLVTSLLFNMDILAMSHIGACGHPGQSAGRDYLGLGFVLLGIFFFLKERYYLYWTCLLVGFLFHMSHGFMAFLVLLPLTLTSRSSNKFKIFHVFSFVALSGCIKAYLSYGSLPMNPAYKVLWFKWCYLFNGGHIYLDHSIGYTIPTYTFLTIIIAGFVLADSNSATRSLPIIISTWLGLALISLFFIYVMPLQIMYQLTPLRSSLLVSWLVLIFLLNLFFKYMIDSDKRWRVLLASLGLIAFFTNSFVGIMSAAFIGCCVIALEHEGKKRVLCLLAGVSIVAVILLNKNQIITYDLALIRHNLKFIQLAAGILTIYSLSAFFKMRTVYLRAIQIVCLVLLLAISLFKIPSRYVAAPQKETIAKLDEYRTISKMIQNQVAPEEAVITAPLLDVPMLEAVAGRGSVFQLAKAHVVYMAPALLPKIDESIADLGINLSSFKGSWIDLNHEAPQIWRKTATTSHVLMLGRKYNATCVLTYVDHKLELPLLFQGVYFSLYSLKM